LIVAAQPHAGGLATGLLDAFEMRLQSSLCLDRRDNEPGVYPGRDSWLRPPRDGLAGSLPLLHPVNRADVCVGLSDSDFDLVRHAAESANLMVIKLRLGCEIADETGRLFALRRLLFSAIGLRM